MHLRVLHHFWHFCLAYHVITVIGLQLSQLGYRDLEWIGNLNLHQTTPEMFYFANPLTFMVIQLFLQHQHACCVTRNFQRISFRQAFHFLEYILQFLN